MDQENKEQEVASRRIKRICFNVPIPAWVWTKVFELLPPDTEIVACGFESYERHLSSIIFKSSHFDVCPEWQVVPELVIKVTVNPRTVSVVEFIKTESGQFDERVYQWQNQEK